jgi:hypothetical protein
LVAADLADDVAMKVLIRRLVAAVVLLVGIAVAAPTTAHADHGSYVSHPQYRGVRWPSTAVCVEDRLGFAYGTVGYANARAATQSISDRTVMTVWRKIGAGSCLGFRQRVILVKGNYGATGWQGISDTMPVCSATRTTGCIRWGITSGGHKTYLWNGYNTVRLNTYHGSQVWDRRTIEHELAHAVGALTHTTYCYSVMSTTRGCGYYTTTWDAGNVAAIMRQ